MKEYSNSKTSLYVIIALLLIVVFVQHEIIEGYEELTAQWEELFTECLNEL